ncbi:MAG: NAD(+)/NADH kinase [Lachnospiraceae bacterium]|nr:NAD(+)/NADH kinase [Lachnospiraceae bacterium]
MEHFFVITNGSKDKGFKSAKKIKEYLEQKGCFCSIATDYGQDDTKGYSTDIGEIPKDTQCVIVLGGDGTILQAANDLAATRLPILGVNLGNLGFLADIEENRLIPAMDKLIANQFVMEERMLLEGSYQDESGKEIKQLALNDIVINKGHYYHLVCVKVYINGKLLDFYIADGVVISSPTGSTGYNLSAGGPVMLPTMEGIIITPICPHSLNNRSLVVSAKDEVVVEIGNVKEEKKDEGILIIDGMIQRTMYTGESISIQKAEKNTRFIKLNGANFLEIFHNKLGMGKDTT